MLPLGLGVLLHERATADAQHAPNVAVHIEVTTGDEARFAGELIYSATRHIAKGERLLAADVV